MLPEVQCLGARRGVADGRTTGRDIVLPFYSPASSWELAVVRSKEVISASPHLEVYTRLLAGIQSVQEGRAAWTAGFATLSIIHQEPWVPQAQQQLPEKTAKAE